MNLSKFKLLEVEIHSYCNRKCDWCPNKDIDRTMYEELPEDIYINLLSDLKEYGFRGAISYSRYNEPFAAWDLLRRRVNQARIIFPEARLVSNTNGDFLTDENVRVVKLDELSIMDYDCEGFNFDYLGITMTSEYKNNLYGHAVNKQVMCALDWPKKALIENRAGALLQKDIKGFTLKGEGERAAPCLEPSKFIGVDYNGSVVPCCHIRSDVKKHKKFVLGDLHDDNIINILNSDKAIEFRERLAVGELASVCKYCHKSPGRYTKNNPNMRYEK